MRSLRGLVLVSCLLFPAVAAAQITTVSGRVMDAQALPIAGATVTALAESGEPVVATTGTDGRYELSALAVGAYVLRVEHPGFVAVEVPIRVTGRAARTEPHSGRRRIPR
jgi:hypothetical protein